MVPCERLCVCRVRVGAFWACRRAGSGAYKEERSSLSGPRLRARHDIIALAQDGQRVLLHRRGFLVPC
jgi:hypothetical protein